MSQPQIVAAVALVVFDVDVGNKVEAVVPVGALSPEEESDVAFSSFPDSMSMELRTRTSVRDTSFFFRVRRRPATAGVPQYLYGFVFCRQRQDERLRRGGEQKAVVVLSALPLTSVLVPVSRFLGPLVLSYGAEALEQVYKEVSLWPPAAWGMPMTLPVGELGAISAQLPELSTVHGAEAFLLPGVAHRGAGSRPGSKGGSLAGSPTRQAAAGTAPLARPPMVVPGVAVAVTVAAPAGAGLGGEYAPGGDSPRAAAALDEDWWLAEMDDQTGLPLCLLPQAYGQQELVEGPFAEVDAYTPLQHVLQQLWGLWELLVLGEPLLIAAPTPAACSSAVAALLSLLAPLPYSCDFRPYLTIHDPSFAPLAGGMLPTPKNGLPCLLGVTNLYFIKALPGWPNVLSTGYAAWQAAQAAGDDGGAGGSEGGMRRSESGQSIASSSGAGGGGNSSSSGGSRLGAVLRRRGHGPQALLSTARDDLWLGFKPTIYPDKEVLGRLVHPRPTDPPAKLERGAQLNTLLLRRHFQELTQALLFPLLPYISPSPPPAAPASATDLQRPPPLPPLDAGAVLANLGDKAGTVPDILLRRFGSHKALKQFYERFLFSHNVKAWLHTRRVVAARWQARAWHQAWLAVGGALNQSGSPSMGEVLAVEEFFELEQRLQRLGLEDDVQEGAALRSRLRTIFAAFPPDLQASLRLSPQHATWLDQPPQSH